MMIRNKYSPWLYKAALLAVLVILVLLPYHAFLTVWIGSNLQLYRAVQLWKEILMIAVFIAVFMAVPRETLKAYWRQNKLLFGITASYIILTLAYGVLAYLQSWVSDKALAFALINNLHFLIFFLIVHLLFSLMRPTVDWFKILMIPAVPVVLFCYLQVFFLPPLFLEHFGYSMFTILPFQYVDNSPELLRAQSFLRGANPLGVYLVIIVTCLVYKLLAVRHMGARVAVAGGLFLSLGALYLTYSRSAWLGLAASLVVLFLARRHFSVLASLRALGLMLASAAVLVVLAVNFADSNKTFSYVVLHANSTTETDSSNSVRAMLLRQGAEESVDNPLGKGPGTAGPSSVHNTRQPALIPENYFLQVAIETGIIGLILFVAVNALVALQLWRQRADGLSVLLLATLVGITLINMVSHAWVDDTVSFLWWGLAGMALGSAVPTRSSVRNSATGQATQPV